MSNIFCDFDFLLFDKLEKLKDINKDYNLLDNSIISFSGGKDSTILHYLIDLAFPNNNIPRVFINTGLEYHKIVDFVNYMKSIDNRFIILNNTNNIKDILNTYGYPYKSKIHSNYVNHFQKNGYTDIIKKYVSNCDIKYQFVFDYNLKISSKCCSYLKKKNISSFMRLNNKCISITGMRRAEGGQRYNIDCLTFHHSKVVGVNPLYTFDDSFIDWFIKKYNIKLCDLYYPPFNFRRTGCKGCPYNFDLQNDLFIMQKYFYNEYLQCLSLWLPVYKDYLQHSFRLDRLPIAKTDKERCILNDIL